MFNMAFLHNLGLPELIILLVIVLLLFGHRLPGIARALGGSGSAFKKGLKDNEQSPAKDAGDTD